MIDEPYTEFTAFALNGVLVASGEILPDLKWKCRRVDSLTDSICTNEYEAAALARSWGATTIEWSTGLKR
jgi:hypothetical protein